jgi:hypothetical protein
MINSFICLFSLENIKYFFSFFFIFIAYYFWLVIYKYKLKVLENKDKNVYPAKTKNLNPIFRHNLIITNEYHCPYLINKNLSCYEIYKLNKIKNAIYIAFTITSKVQIKIIKINLSNKAITELISLKFDNFVKKIKYFFDKLQNKEYLFICLNKKIIIYLFKAENKLKKILEYEQKGKAGGRVISTTILPIYDFEIFFNKFDNNIYLIVTFLYSGSCTSSVRDIKILNFNNNKIFLINEIKSSIRYEPFISSLFLIWEDNISKKIFLITNIYNNLRILDIFNIKSSFIYQEKKMDGFNRHLGENGCIIKSKENDYLYLGDNEGNLRIINLRNKQIIKQINIPKMFIVSLENWNDKYLIIGDTSYIYVYNTDINRIISKYLSIFNKGRIHHIKKFFYEEYNFCSLCVSGSDNIIRLFY